MPKGTRVERCYTKLMRKHGKAAAAAICQKATHQSLATGRGRTKTGRRVGGRGR